MDTGISEPLTPDAPAEFPVIFVTGLSGAGKSTVLNVFEDLNYFTMEGLPASIITQVAAVLNRDNLAAFQGLTIGLSLLSPDEIRVFEQTIAGLRSRGIAAGVLFMEASDAVLMQRYATTRRPHPLEREGLGLERAIAMEKGRLASLKGIADLVIDSSGYSIHDLRRVIQHKWQRLLENVHALNVHLISFGFKYGTPAEADLVFDLRFLPNPYFVPELRPFSGLDAAVSDYVLGREPGRSYLTRLSDFLLYQLPLFEHEGRYRLTIGIGCTGGRHRSVASTQALAAFLKTRGYAVSTEHRHLELG